MANNKRIEYVTRDSILKLLSDDEVASVSTAETAARLSARPVSRSERRSHNPVDQGPEGASRGS